jgi:hypothetical protein
VASERYLAVVGLGEEDTARLRLLLRMVGGQLENRWRWGAEENADLMIVDPGELAGQIARNRAFSSGRRCAVFSESEPLRDGELRLTKPPKAEDLTAVLNGSTSSATPLTSPLVQQKDDFYGIDALSPEFAIEDDDAQEARSRRRESNPALGLEEFLKPDEASKKPQFAVPIDLNEDTLIESTGGQSKRGERRVADSIEGFRKPVKPEPANMMPPVKRGAPTTDSSKHWLRDYLRGNLLGGPATFTADGVPGITLDPKENTFHSTAPLSVLAAYCKEPLSAHGWKRITTADLANVRSAQPGRPYAKLVWLDALIQADGRLASHLDPGGRYRLKATPQIERDFPNHARIAEALREPAKLNEIAAASGAPMAEVFALVSAYDAIGLIDVERRLPRHDPAPAPSGLFARLRKPFGKH